MKKLHKSHLKKTLSVSLFILIVTLSLNSKPRQSVLEADKIVLKTPEGKPALVLDASSGVAKVTFLNNSEKIQMELTGGDSPNISLRDSQENEMMQISMVEDNSVVLALKDKNEISRVQIQGGGQPAYFLKNEKNEITATLLTLQDGGTALGLADKDGDVSAFLRGGQTPSISFFQKSVEPSVALGISKNIPHLLVASPTTKDNLVLHGGEPTSVLFVDDKGDIPVLLSKHGLFQGKRQQTQTEPSSEEKIFTWENLVNPLEDLKLKKR
jgi:hypothetical protein